MAPQQPAKADPEMPIIGEEEADQEEDEVENGMEEKKHEEEPSQERLEEMDIEPHPLKLSEAQAISKETP